MTENKYYLVVGSAAEDGYYKVGSDGKLYMIGSVGEYKVEKENNKMTLTLSRVKPALQFADQNVRGILEQAVKMPMLPFEADVIELKYTGK